MRNALQDILAIITALLRSATNRARFVAEILKVGKKGAVVETYEPANALIWRRCSGRPEVGCRRWSECWVEARTACTIRVLRQKNSSQLPYGRNAPVAVIGKARGVSVGAELAVQPC